MFEHLLCASFHAGCCSCRQGCVSVPAWLTVLRPGKTEARGRVTGVVGEVAWGMGPRRELACVGVGSGTVQAWNRLYKEHH